MNAPTHKQLLTLQRMEMSLVRAVLAKPSFLVEREYKQLRYLLSFARLHVFAPGGLDGAPRRADVELAQDLIAPLRERVLKLLYKPLRREEITEKRLGGAVEALRELYPALVTARRQLLRRHQDDFSEAELDAEVGRKALVTIMGGGGGAGYVYIGAAARLRAEQKASDYLVGASIGALIGAFLTRARQLDIDALMAWAKGLRTRHIFARPYIGATHTLPGLMRLHLQGMARHMRHPDGTPLRLNGIERLAVYRASVSWDDRNFRLDGFYRTGHYHWGYEGDFFGLYREANYGKNIDIYNGNAPAGVEFTGKRKLTGLKLAFGPELWWGANPTAIAKYGRKFGETHITAMYQEDVAKISASATTSTRS